MLHGGAHTGACYKITPDGRLGWAYNFAEAGYEVIITDWPGVGRSGYINPEELTGEFIVNAITELLKTIGHKVILFTHSMSGPYGWMLLEKAGEYIEQLIAVSPGAMGNIQSIPEILSQTEDSLEVEMGPIKYNLSLTNNFICSEDYSMKKFIGKIPMPPRLIHDRLNIKGSQMKMSDSFKAGDTKISIIVGTDDADHPYELDIKIHEFLVGLGVKSEFIWLGDYEIEVVANPLDVMTYCTYLNANLPSTKVFGMAGILDTARYKAFLATELNCNPKDIQGMLMGGHGDTMVPLPRYTTVSGIPVTELIAEDKLTAILERTKVGGGEIVKLLGTSAWYAPGAAAAQMAESI
ncbi:unnamed protein product, partial [Rotaria sp. Silwood1]